MHKYSGNSSNQPLADYLTKHQLAEALKKSPRTLDRWAVLRIGPPRVYAGKTPLYHLESVRRWLESQTRK